MDVARVRAQPPYPPQANRFLTSYVAFVTCSHTFAVTDSLPLSHPELLRGRRALRLLVSHGVTVA